MARNILPKHQTIYNELIKFITNCSVNAKSVQNYTDFKRINECLSIVTEKEDVSVLDYTNPFEFVDIVKLLSKNDKFKEYNKKGNNQYSSAIQLYQNFLFARLYASLPKDISDKSVTIPLGEPLQQIYYGAPGTGKSFHVDEVCKKYEHFRTTFHPDSDYSTFVGCYKPIKETLPSKRILEANALEEILKNNLDNRGKNTQYDILVNFGIDFWQSLSALEGKELTDIVRNALNRSGTISEDGVVKSAVKLAKRNAKQRGKITYDFVPQAFTNAYIKAWELHESNTPVFLVVEEINRGNCAQIFGDLFQLLDRNDEGYSTYEITPDTDLQDYISQQGLTISGVTDSDGKDISAEIASGKLMKLPNNLHIWATMNTSDQSLFPIDSAFKRRWDWVYKPIKYDNEVWKVVLADGSWCWWVDLQQTLNDLIYDATESEDKMLGDWFVRAENNVISEEVLVGKIIFYLWNDVAKVDAGKLFDLEVEKNGRKSRKVIFSDFYKTNEKIDSKVVKDWLNNINVAIFEKDIADDDPEHAALTDSKPEYVRILDEIEAKCKEQGVENKVKGNSINIKLGDYAMSKLRVAVSLNNTGTPNADVKLWISSSSAKSIDTRDKLRKYGAGEFFENLAKESDKLSCVEIGKEYPDSESRTRGWRLTSTAITFEEAKASEEAEWIFDKVQRIREHFKAALD